MPPAPSFPAFRRQRLDAVAAAAATPTRIQDLVDCIHQHPDYVTLSSCSGRFAVFDPCNTSTTSSTSTGSGTAGGGDDLALDSATKTCTCTCTCTCTAEEETFFLPNVWNSRSGEKDDARWLFTTHDQIDTEDQRRAFLQAMLQASTATGRNAPDHACSFILTSIHLHVAACGIGAAQRLLQAALQTGFSESGLCLDPHDDDDDDNDNGSVLVSIRTPRGGLIVPIGAPATEESTRGGEYYQYTQMVLAQGNASMRENWQQLRRLHGGIERALFPERSGVVQVMVPDERGCASAGPQQAPRLVRAAGALLLQPREDDVAAADSEQEVRCILLGGYETGSESKDESQARSNAVHVLSSAAVSSMANVGWESVQHPRSNLKDETIILLSTSHGPLRVRPLPWAPRVGATAVSLGDQYLLVVGGHNEQPARPVEPVVVLYDAQHHTAYTIVVDKTAMMFVSYDDDETTETLTPRWGHTCTPLTSSSWLCVGGRNSTQVLQDDSVVLVQLETDTMTGHACISYQRRQPYPVFDHAAVALPGATPSTTTTTTHVLVHGGLNTVDHPSTPPTTAAVVLDPSSWRATPQPIHLDPHFHRFGHQVNRIPQRTSVFHWILLTGGVPSSEDDSAGSSTPSAAVACFCLDLLTTPTRPTMTQVPLRVDAVDDAISSPAAEENSSVFAHHHHHQYHCALTLPPTTSNERTSRIVLVGGSAATAATRPCCCTVLQVEIR